jgi:antitoxin Phd
MAALSAKKGCRQLGKFRLVQPGLPLVDAKGLEPISHHEAKSPIYAGLVDWYYFRKGGRLHSDATKGGERRFIWQPSDNLRQLVDSKSGRSVHPTVPFQRMAHPFSDRLDKMAKMGNSPPMALTLKIRQSQDSMQKTIADLPRVTASSLKNNFGEVGLLASKGALAITRHNRAEYVLLPIAQFVGLQRAQHAPLEALATEFDNMVARMNTPTARRGVAKLFRAAPAELAKIAVKAASANAR